ncbi:heterokaryon incompatibility protein-domain-containing protein [Astrocystis sublimbata]|nr:heterokaryon incompatibility protein-domain-containing protein [Astrocystis sublimbata]
MRLLNVHSFEIEEFYDPPEYAILSHTWDKVEVTLQQWQSSPTDVRRAYQKAAGSARLAAQDGFAYVWIDTICIDKTSSAELQEAINSMFSWYEDAGVCYAYLSDVHFVPGSIDANLNLVDAIRRSKWFTRGWTLQELIAPSKLLFYSHEWNKINGRNELGDLISQITGIRREYLWCEQHSEPERARTFPIRKLSSKSAPVAERLSWASNRVTTRPEDIAYCLLGLLEINMPLLYGEKGKAWIRLQKELVAVSDDESIFAWVMMPQLEALIRDQYPGRYSPLIRFGPNKISSGLDIETGPRTRLASLVRTGWTQPKGSTMFAPDPVNFYGWTYHSQFKSRMMKLPYSITNGGVRMQLPLLRLGTGTPSCYLARLQCRPTWDQFTDVVLIRSSMVRTSDTCTRDSCWFLGSRIEVESRYLEFDSAAHVYLEDVVADEQQQLMKEPSANFYGFWIVFPKGIGFCTIRDEDWTRKNPSACAYDALGLYGFNTESKQYAYRSSLMLRRVDGKISFELNFGIEFHKDGGVTWTYDIITKSLVETPANLLERIRGSAGSCRAHRDIPTSQLRDHADVANSDKRSLIYVSFGGLNVSSWPNGPHIRMVYITFKDNNELRHSMSRYDCGCGCYTFSNATETQLDAFLKPK